jgi:hypothetical protein
MATLQLEGSTAHRGVAHRAQAAVKAAVIPRLKFADPCRRANDSAAALAPISIVLADEGSGEPDPFLMVKCAQVLHRAFAQHD